MGILRLILALAVVIDHSYPVYGLSLVNGRTAVEAFFIISGFYMTMIIREKYSKIPNSYKLFITNRFLRLYPVYWTLLGLLVISSIAIFFVSDRVNFGYLQPYSDNFLQGNLTIPSLLFLGFTNFSMFLQDMIMFMGYDTQTGELFFTKYFWRTGEVQAWHFLLVPQAWTIGLELTYYLIAPFLVKRNLKVILFLIFASLCLRLIFISQGYSFDPWTYRFFPFELLFFLLGTVAYEVYIYFKKKEINFKEFKWLPALFVILTVLCGMTSDSYAKDLVFTFLVFLGIPFLFMATKNNKLDGKIGEFSYPVYICHMAVIEGFHRFGITNTKPLGDLTIVIITILVSYVMIRFVSDPIEKIRARRVTEKKQVAV
jgi:peptidoglycan/LPS O-acetylase OafA/YrhL